MNGGFQQESEDGKYLQESLCHKDESVRGMNTRAAFHPGDFAVPCEKSWPLQLGSRQTYLSQQSTGLQMHSGS